MTKKRDASGRFTKGNKEGNRFNEKNQPSVSGRKPSRFKKILENLEGVGESMSKEDYQNITAKLLTMTVEEITKIAEDPETPIAIIMIANAINGDINNMRIDNMERIMDRTFGKIANSVDVTTKGESLKPINIIPMKGVKQTFASNESEVDE